MSKTTPDNSDRAVKKKTSFGRKILIVIVVLFLAAQLYPVDRTNPEVVADIIAPDNVKSILKRACYDCHSNETKWLWYSYISPGSILIASDVHEGRDVLNFSTWTDDYADEEDTPEMFLDVCWDAIESKEMPLWFYLPLHPEAVLTDEDINILKAWCGVEDSEEEDEETVDQDSEESDEEEVATSDDDTEAKPAEKVVQE
ncbi:MAG: heme-binding domain-containing protein [Planctomycetaceae bacterium]|nr:heme-binding domain-containing protein [Planctomycetaceae bacterium]